MTIRKKRTILLLCISLVPLTVILLLHNMSIRYLKNHVTHLSTNSLTSSAEIHLESLINDYQKMIEQDRITIEAALRSQKRQVETRLARPVPARPAEIYTVDDYKGLTGRTPGGMTTTDIHMKDGKSLPVSLSNQVYLISPGVDLPAVSDDMKRLADLARIYRSLRETLGEITFLWQYSTLDSGVHISYPGKGEYPPDYVATEREWYLDAKANIISGQISWRLVSDASTHEIILTASMPFFYSDGKFAGVTGLDMRLAGLFRGLVLPENWSREATVLQVICTLEDEVKDRLLIAAQQGTAQSNGHWARPVEVEFAQADTAGDTATLARSVRSGKSGMLRMKHNGVDSIWVHGAWKTGQLVPLVIIPSRQVAAASAEVEQYILDATRQLQLFFGGIILIVVIVAVIVAILSSRAVTEPVRQLAQAAAHLSSGNFQAKVRINTNDELEQLGKNFNEIGPKLYERDKLKRSMAVAMEVQQHLLPQHPPQVDGVDISGDSVYCDETGGDYYDFIELVELGEGIIGIAVGDVTGHGIGAALLMASARSVLRSHAANNNDNLDQLFNDINVHLVRDTGEARFITLFYAVLDVSDRSLRWVSAGHDPAIWLKKKTGEFDHLPATGTLLGAFSEARFEQAGPVIIEPGDVLVIGTDGIWESRNPAGELYGKARFHDVIEANASKTSSEIHQAVIDSVKHFSSTHPQEDDITLVVIKGV